jgi:hypothetical protein
VGDAGRAHPGPAEHPLGATYPRRGRTNGEYGELLAVAGLRPGIIRPVTFPYGVIEGRPA